MAGRLLLILLILAGSHAVINAQVPRIDNIDRAVAYPNMPVQITGQGFSANPADLQVWFGNVQGTILSSSVTSIDVLVPAQARVSPVEVINLVSKRSGKSGPMVMPTFSGSDPMGTFTLQSFASPANDIFDMCTCDFNLDGKTDIVGSKFRDGASNLMLMTNTSTVHANSTTLGFTVSSIPLASIPTYSLACGDLNGDGKPEIVATRGGNSSGSNVYIFPNTSAGTISFGTPISLTLTPGDFGKEVAIRDLNGDGRPEIIVTNSQTSLFYIFENKLTSATITAAQFTRINKSIPENVANDGTIAGTLALVVEDFNGDGWPEIVVTPSKSYANQKTFILANPANGTLNFTQIVKFTVNGTANINDLASADFNGDGKLDLVYSDRQSAKAFVLLNQGGLDFTSVNGMTGFPVADAWGVDVADMNGDGLADFIVGSRNFTTPEVNIFTNNGGATPGFAKSVIATTPTKGNWFVKAADYDGDSKPDIAVTTTNNVNNFSIDIWRNTTCHDAKILNDNPLTICSGQSIELQAVPVDGVAFTWSGGSASGAKNTIAYTDAGTITVTAVGEGGACTSTASIVVNAGAGLPPGKPTILQPDVVCAGGELKLATASVGGATYLWTGPNDYAHSGTSNEAVVTNAAAIGNKGNYFLRIKVGDCVSEESSAKFVDVIAPAAFSITGVTPICAGQPLSLSVNTDPAYDFQWKFNGTAVASEDQSQFPKVGRNAVGADAGNYTVVATHKTFVSCKTETPAFTMQVFNAPSASVTFTPNVVCEGAEVLFNGSNSTVHSGAPVQYTWSFGDGKSRVGDNLTTVTHTYTASAAAVSPSLTISYPGITGCSNTFNVPVFAVSAVTNPEISSVPESVTALCSGSELSLTASGSFSSFTWNNGQTTPTITITQPGVYWVQTINADGCLGRAEVEILPRTSGCSDTGSELLISKMFTPNNGDNLNDTWRIIGIENLDTQCNANIFDGRGRRVVTLTKDELQAGWRGTTAASGGADLPQGTYYYVIGCPDGRRVTGSVLIAR